MHRDDARLPESMVYSAQKVLDLGDSGNPGFSFIQYKPAAIAPAAAVPVSLSNRPLLSRLWVHAGRVFHSAWAIGRRPRYESPDGAFHSFVGSFFNSAMLVHDAMGATRRVHHDFRIRSATKHSSSAL